MVSGSSQPAASIAQSVCGQLDPSFGARHGKECPGGSANGPGDTRSRQAAHLQPGAQAAPGWHLHVEPHSQVGPQAQDIPRFWLAMFTAVEFESKPLAVEFI
jgi:hypothetical protein